MNRGEVWTLPGGGDFVSKPRPVVVLQDDRFAAVNSVTICPLTTSEGEAPLFRLPIEPNPNNGLESPSRIIADKVTTVRRTRLRERLGQLDDGEMRRLSEAVMVFLGFAEPGATSEESEGQAKLPLGS